MPAPAVVTGRTVEVVVPGSSANLGPGYDALGLALGVTDVVTATALPPGAGVRVEVSGEGSGRVAEGEEHLVVRSLRAALHRAGVPAGEQPGLHLVAHNGVPHGRGVGSSAAAVVAGVVAASALLAEPLSADDQLDVAAGLEGHPDNAAASLWGGLTLGWHTGAADVVGEHDPGPTSVGAAPVGPVVGRHRRHWRAVRVEPSPDFVPLLCVPGVELSTARARAMLPLQVPHGDAAFTAGRAALLVEAVTRRTDLLLEATEDRLHQPHRAPAMPQTWELVTALRAAGHAAVVSGAGPSVLVLCADAGRAEQAARAVAAHRGWTALMPGVSRTGAVSREVGAVAPGVAVAADVVGR